MNARERREYHKRWRESTDRAKFLEGQRRRHREWYYSNLDKAREKARLQQAKARAKDPEKFRAYIRERWRIVSARNRRFVNAYKEAFGCFDCGFRDCRALDLDHVRGSKRLRVTNMVNWGWPLATIVKELEKCEVRCANCHRIRHHQEKEKCHEPMQK